MVTVFHYTPVNAKQFDGLNIDGLAGKHQKCQNFVLCGKWFWRIVIYVAINTLGDHLCGDSPTRL